MIIPGHTQVPNYYLDVLMPKLSGAALRVLLIVTRQTLGWIEDPLTKRRKEKDWISYSQLSEKTGMFKQALTKAMRELETMKVIEVLDENGNKFESTSSRRGKRLIYRLNTDMGENHPSMGENQISIITHTKETHTKEDILTSSETEKVSSFYKCPLTSLNGEFKVLKEKYPGGHKECIEYIDSIARSKGHKFVNYPKQIRFVHQILRSGFVFENMDKAVDFLENDKFYREKGWDFANIAQYLEKH